MRRISIVRAATTAMITIMIAVVPAVAGCARGSAPSPALSPAPGGFGGSAEPATVEDFAALVRAGINVDYEPTRSPEDAVAQADLIVVGRVTDVTDGVAIEYEDPALTSRGLGGYVTFTVSVDRVISGDGSLVASGVVHAQVLKSPATSTRDLAAANPMPGALLILDEWQPTDGTVVPPDQLAASATVLFPRPDGLWLQTSPEDGMVGLYAAPEELGAPWGGPRTLDDLTDALSGALG